MVALILARPYWARLGARGLSVQRHPRAQALAISFAGGAGLNQFTPSFFGDARRLQSRKSCQSLGFPNSEKEASKFAERIGCRSIDYHFGAGSLRWQGIIQFDPFCI